MRAFADLRLNNRSQNEEGFWPSFTDIMTVIVMIFLMAMLTLLLRNMDLVQRLQSSLRAERSANRQVQSTSATNTQLKQRLAELEKETAMFRLQLMDLSDEHRQTLAELKARQAEVASLNGSNAALTNEKQALADQLSSTKTQLADNQNELASTRGELAKSRNRVATLTAAQNDSRDRIAQLQGRFHDLKAKYDKLIRPARSPIGRFVVQVRFSKVGGQLLTEIKSPDDALFTRVTDAQLHHRLDAIKKRQGDQLYVKIIFPEKSGLSYTEAWNLTEPLLREYDYYYQEGPATP